MCNSNRPRPFAHHKVGQREPHLLALIRLHSAGWSAALIAETLSVLTPDAIRLLELRDTWDRAAVDAAILDCESIPSTRLPWTTRQVKHYRKALCLPHRAIRVEHERSTLLDQRYRQAQIVAKFGHLLGPRQLQVCCLLRDKGPMTRQEIIRALGVETQGRPLRSHTHAILPTLVRAAVVEGQARRAYALSALAKRA
jgi:hypothetical protein